MEKEPIGEELIKINFGPSKTNVEIEKNLSMENKDFCNCKY